MNRLVPYKGWSYERDLIEYCGSVIVDSGQTLPIAIYACPGLQIVRNSAGNYTINMLDKLPIYAQVANNAPSAPDLSCIDQGFASSCMIWVSARPQQYPAATVVQIQASQVQLIDRAQIAFTVESFVATVATDISFSFRIWITGQPAKYVPGLGA